MQGETQTSQAR